MLTTVKKKMKIGGKRKTPSDSSNFESLSRTMSVMSGIDFDEEYIHPQINGSLCEHFSDTHFTDNAHGSETASTVNSFHRSPSIDSGASSGFGGSNKFSKMVARSIP
ncbi:hypothetical protein Q1695_011790 [Nippostrongylus brasiliensis]|nr:hypothetical protein Q1695_011790 [Nippostrongylus brasiliensis]